MARKLIRSIAVTCRSKIAKKIVQIGNQRWPPSGKSFLNFVFFFFFFFQNKHQMKSETPHDVIMM